MPLLSALEYMRMRALCRLHHENARRSAPLLIFTLFHTRHTSRLLILIDVAHLLMR